MICLRDGLLSEQNNFLNQLCIGLKMRVRASVKRICRNCKIIRRNNVVRVICTSNPRHKQRQG